MDPRVCSREGREQGEAHTDSSVTHVTCAHISLSKISYMAKPGIQAQWGSMTAPEECTRSQWAAAESMTYPTLSGQASSTSVAVFY